MNKLEHVSNEMRDLKKEFDLLIKPHRPALWRYCEMITGSPWDAEDLVQDTLLKSYSALPRIFQPLIPKSYLFRIATNTWLNQQRKQNRILLGENTEESHEDLDPFELREAMEKLVAYLSPKQRVVILLFDVFQFRGSEVAEMIGSTEGSVKALLHRARTNLKKLNHKEHHTTSESESVFATDPVIEAYLDAFNRRDPDAIANLLDENAINDIVHTSFEYGKKAIRNHSLEGWANDPMPMTATYQMLWGKPVIVVITKLDGNDAVYSLIDLEMDAGVIVKKRTYYFCQDLLETAAKELQIPVYPNGYIYGE
ncbi:sigma-70 family RNA polymerase sigma factor [Radiobacillus kanasensis]|uniref:sigma-70 family RNA polymerase sigma factor n=1 Tax=Radiobacillus kanasensis TaxID=2844358 RepID=UPI001E3F54A2|nr:sigma-70 family RNA polymerase sigma factor [Radiobacillus kanasensis]UFU00126.1 sigma-70 family RNA polymerase sigma factor [Radiobacillus kanasensis]